MNTNTTTIAYRIDTIEDATNLVNFCDKYDFPIDVVHRNQTIDGKSVLGVASLIGKIVGVVPHINPEALNAEFMTNWFTAELKALSKCY